MSVPALELGEYSRVVTYSKSSNESVGEGIYYAFDAAGIDINNEDEVLFDQIDDDGLNMLIERSGRHLRVSTELWDHTVIITPEDITIYQPHCR